jgi:hypothetical protein
VRRIGPLLALVALGAAYVPAAGADPATPAHWAFQPVKRPAIPTVRDASWPRNDIDRFILAKLEELALEPSPAADRRTLLRRVHFDLTGLPPAPEEAAAFEKNNSPNAFQEVIERLLASPRHGERWGRHWMDVVRYADTAGDNADYPIPEAHLYRDYIIDAFNSDKPYDQFVREQLAGDILAERGPPARYAERVTATGFLALSRRYATAPFEFMHLTIEDAIETTGRAFLGMTFRCARCHDHKYDPVTREDYYALYGLFESTRFPYAGSEEFQSKGFGRSGFHPLLPPGEYAPVVKAHEERLAALESDIERLKKEVEAAGKDAGKKHGLEESLKALSAERAGLKKAGSPAALPVAYAVEEGKPVDSRLQPRGEPDELGPAVRRRAPRFLSGDEVLDIPEGASGRLPFAEWLTRPENPLTARVIVNRIWLHHFGRGLVATPGDFGANGARPTHPELLDWLACELVEKGWRLKEIHRLILLSSTYRQSSRPDARGLAADAETALYWRYPPRRLEAEAIRDSVLFLSGKLDFTMGGPGFDVFAPNDNYVRVYEPKTRFGPAEWRRMVYQRKPRKEQDATFGAFDCPDATQPTSRRPTSTNAVQALNLLNAGFIMEQTGFLAERLRREAGDDAVAQARRGFLLAFGRGADAVEEAAAAALIREHGCAAFARALFNASELLYIP